MDTINATIAEGDLQGRVYKTPSEKIYYGFTAIPYAEEPTGHLRFKEPVPVKKWDSLKNATKESECFIQFDLKERKTKGSEKLLLNVYTPKLKSQGAEPMPVMVFFHGGGFLCGSAEKATCGPDFLIEKDVVFVTVHCRLGLLGFLCLDIPEAPGNAGLKDQLLALKWVQKNIAVFNGDPSNVTIFGTSAGAASVEYHLLSPHGNGLFHKAIGLSGSVLNPWAFHVDPIKNATEAARSLGKDIKDKRELLDFFVSSSSEDLAKATTNVQEQLQKKHKRGLACSFVPVKEQRFPGVMSFLKEYPIEILKSGGQKVIPFITGFCEKEGSLMANLAPDTMKYALAQDGLSTLSSFKIDNNAEIVSKLNEEYVKKFETEKERENSMINFIGDNDFSGGIAYSAKLHAAKNPNVYFYMFTYDGKFNLSKKMMNVSTPKATHADQEGYIVRSDILTEIGTKADIRCRDRVVEMFTTFAKTGNPTPSKMPLLPIIWELLQYNKMKCLVIGEELKIEENSVEKLTKLWERVYEHPLVELQF